MRAEMPKVRKKPLLLEQPPQYTLEKYTTTAQLRESSFFRALLENGLILDSAHRRAPTEVQE